MHETSSVEHKCKNCGKEVDENFCSHCGQSIKVERINISYLLHNLIYSLFHVDKGILHTMKELTFRPGATIREYLAGKRINQFRPFSYLVIMSAIYVFLFINSGLNDLVYDFSNLETEIIDIAKIWTSWSINHFTLLYLFLIPFSSIFTFLLFSKSKFNYGENLIINTYISAHQILLTILLLPFSYALHMADMHNYSSFLDLSSIALEFIMLYSVFNMYSRKSRIARCILYFFSQGFISFIINIIIIAIIAFSKYYQP